ncbi:MAG: hypothetical protein ABL982_09035 [Vicinamibacterales bacterium]
MKFPKMIPALADLTQDIAGPVPVELLREWASGTTDEGRAAELLRPFAITGTVVATDTSGLSHLTRERDLLEVLAMVSHPKEIVHAVGREIGGRAIGTWVADNTEMFYAADRPVSEVVAAMADAQARINLDGEVRLGMCVHWGDFYEIGGGLYGRDAELVEYLAERFSAPGDVLLTEAVRSHLPAGCNVQVQRRPELDVVHAPGVFALTAAPPMTLAAADIRYPHGFTDEVFRALHQLRAADAPRLREEIYRSLLHERVVVFVSRERGTTDGAPITALLDTLTGDAVFDAVLQRFPAAVAHTASLGGGLAILCFEDAEEALQVSYGLRDACLEMGIGVKVGIDAGPVLLFTNHRGPSGVSGDAVNIASKLCEDLGVENMVNVTARAAAPMRDIQGGVPFTARLSRVEVSGIRL